MNINSIVDEINPKKDMERHNSRGTFKEKMIDSGWFGVNNVKSFVRGWLVGACLGIPIGAVSSLASGRSLMQEMLESAQYTSGLGAALDVAQYMTRWINHLFKKDLFSLWARATTFSIVGGLVLLATYTHYRYADQLKTVNTSFIRLVDTNSDNLIDRIELEIVNRRLQDMYGVTNFVPITNTTQLTGIQKADYVNSKGETLDSKFIYFYEKRMK